MRNFKDGREYRIALNLVPPEAVEPVVAELVMLFPIEPQSARDIVQAAPIVLVDKLTAQQARNAETHLGFLRRLGARVEITSRGLSSLKRLNLPVKPDIVRRPGNVFICPTCGDRLVVGSLGTIAPAVPVAPEKKAVAEKPAPVESAKPAPKPAAPVGKSWPKIAGAETPARQEPPSEAGDPRTKTAGRPRPPEAGSVESSAPKPKTQKAEVKAPGKAMPVSEPSVTRELTVDEEATGRKKGPSAGDTAAAQQPAPAPGEAKCRVSIAKKLKRSQRTSAAELIAKYQNIPLEEAIAATKKSVIVIMRNVTKEQAEECKKECKDLGISAQINER